MNKVKVKLMGERLAMWNKLIIPPGWWTEDFKESLVKSEIEGCAQANGQY